jgi:hypothetical protein
MRKDGYFGGLVEYRYGSRPKPRHVRIYSGQQREHVVHRIFEAMRGWHLSPFEFEGSVRASIRGTLCLAGHRWGASDQEASALVAEALGRLRAVRPTWEQGQPEYSTPSENCRRCGGPIPEDLEVGGRNHRFCSDICARAAIEQRDYEGLRKDSEAYRAAWDIIQRTKSVPIACRHCLKEFRPVLGKASVYCSRECSAAARIVVPDRACRACGQMFHPPGGNRQDAGFFCSQECVWKHRATIQIEKICHCCGSGFVTKSPKAAYCSTACARVVSKFRNGRNLPKNIAPHVFDYVFKMAA